MEDHEILQSLLLEEEVRPFVYGVVTIHIKGAVDLRPHINGSRLGLRFHVRNLLKKTRGASVTNESCQWNQVKHLPVKLVRAPRHVFNMLRVEVLCYPREHGFVETEYASICFHLHELASHSFLRGNFDMYSNMTRVGQLQLELAFNYGLYGYGHSPQLSDAMGSFEQLPPELRVRHSLYPRVQPPDDRTDFASATLIPPAVLHPTTLIPFRNDSELAEIGYGPDVRQFLESDFQTESANQQNWDLLHSCMTRLGGLRDRYLAARGPQERIALLQTEISAHHSLADTVSHTRRVHVHTSAPKNVPLTPASSQIHAEHHHRRHLGLGHVKSNLSLKAKRTAGSNFASPTPHRHAEREDPSHATDSDV